MLCDNFFCIYYSQGECILDEIELDIQGSCKCCIYIKMGEKELQKKRDELLYRSY